MVSLPLSLVARRVLPTAALCLALATSAQAQGTDEQREACTPDALKLCSDTIPDIPKTTACMKAHQAALSPRCRAVFDEPATKEPAVAAASRSAEATRKTHARREAAREERESSAPRHRKETMAEPYADPLRGADVDAAGVEDRGVPPGGPPDGYGGPDIRHFAPGDGPDEAGPPPPYGAEREGGGPRDLGPGAWDGPRFADRGGPDGFDAPGPRRGRPPDFDGPPDGGPDDGGPSAERDDRPRRGARPARTVIARMCARGEIDPHTCAETMRALGRRHD